MLGNVNKTMIYEKLAGKKEGGGWKTIIKNLDRNSCSKYFYNKIYAFYFVIYTFKATLELK